MEVERLRAAAATEITHDEVRPIETDFHFFVKENMKEYLKLAEEDVRKSRPDSDSSEEPLDPYLVNTNLNSRLLKAWEQLTPGSRDTYMQKEEEDRRRFMEEDEIASRHCATLTARGKSPRDGGGSNNVKKEERQETEENGKLPASSSEPGSSNNINSSSRDDSPSSKVKEEQQTGGDEKPVEMVDGDGNNNDDDEETMDVTTMETKHSPTTAEDEIQESPTKKSRVEEG